MRAVTSIFTNSPSETFAAKTFLIPHIHHGSCSLKWKKKEKRFSCKLDLSGDAPFALAIGGCIASSLLLPSDAIEEEESSGMDSTDTRLAVMGIISFIPFFNWLSWVFAWVDTGKPRYGVYTLVYMASYIRSLSGEDSWLPIASVLLGVIHVQLETSVKYGEIQLFSKATNLFSPNKNSHRRELQSSEEESENANDDDDA